MTSNSAPPIKEPDFATLQQKITAVSPPGTLMNDYNPSLKPRDGELLMHGSTGRLHSGSWS